MMKIYFILPVFNEQAFIVRQLMEIDATMKKIGKEYFVYIVDDGSNDNTRKELYKVDNRFSFKVIEHQNNLGPGAAFRTGFNEVMKAIKDNDAIITMDADCTQSPRTIVMMLDKLEEGYEVVIGSCFAPGGMLIGVPFIRYLITCTCNILYKIVFPIKGVTTYTGFFRCYSGSSLKQAFDIFGDKLIELNGFPAISELLINLRRIPLFITEVPMIMRYNLKKGKSKMHIFPTIWGHLYIIGRNLFKRKIF